MLRDRIGLEWVKPHHLRKTAATRVEAMFGLEAASRFLGHASVAVTQKYYLQPREHSAPDVRGALWSKLILNCAYNALSAIAQLPYGRLVQGEGVDEVMRDVIAECIAVALADGVSLPGDVEAAAQDVKDRSAEDTAWGDAD